MREPTADPFVPSAKRLALQVLWWCVILWPLMVAVAWLVARALWPTPLP